VPKFLVLYYDIGWNTHAMTVEAGSGEAAIESMLAGGICTRHEVITYYEVQS
jgi:hypothetical protein